MNIILFELKRVWKTMLIWALSFLAVEILFFYGMFPAYRDSAEALLPIMDKFPPAFLEIFGFSPDLMFGYTGFSGFIYLYTGLMGIIMAVSMSVSVFGREKKAHCEDFLLTKPNKKITVLLRKALVVLGMMTLIMVIFAGISFKVFIDFAGKEVLTRGFLLTMLGMYIIEVLFVAFGMFLSLFLKKIRSISGLGVTTGIGVFVLSSVINLLDKKELNIFAPLKYFDPVTILNENKIDLKYFFISFALIVCLTLISVWKFKMQDIRQN